MMRLICLGLLTCFAAIVLSNYMDDANAARRPRGFTNFWSYHSSDISSPNDFNNVYRPARLSTVNGIKLWNAQYWGSNGYSHTTRPEEYLALPFNHSPVTLLSDGRIQAKKSGQFADEHIMFEIGATGSKRANMGPWSPYFKLDTDYQYSFDIELVDNGTDWWNQSGYVIVHQLWGPLDGYDEPRNPSFAIEIRNGEWKVVRRYSTADDTPNSNGQYKSLNDGPNSGYGGTSFADYDSVPFAGPGTYTVNVYFRGDDDGNNGYVLVNIGGQWVKWDTACQTCWKSNSPNFSAGVPNWGIYTYQPESNQVEAIFDNIKVSAR